MSDELQIEASGDDEIQEFEEITSEEVDRVVGLLEELTKTVESENIRTYLEEAVNNIYYLVYDDEEEAEDEAFSEAA